MKNFDPGENFYDDILGIIRSYINFNTELLNIIMKFL